MIDKRLLESVNKLSIFTKEIDSEKLQKLKEDLFDLKIKDPNNKKIGAQLERVSAILYLSDVYQNTEEDMQ